MRLHGLSTPSRRLNPIRRLFGVCAGILTAVLPTIAAVTYTTPVGATAEYSNASVADTALKYVGRWGGQACIDSHKPGDYGGQCRSFVNCIVWMASAGTQNLGGRDYFQPFIKAGGKEINTIGELQRGDIVQEGQGSHTYIIAKRLDGNNFTVVDSNKRWNERVSTYDREVKLSYNKRAFRMGAPGGDLSSAPARLPQPMMGNLDRIEMTEEGAVARGWAMDGDVTRPIDVRFYEVTDPKKPTEGRSLSDKANKVRMDLASSYPEYGSSHGFRTFLPLPSGAHVICAYAINAADTPGTDLNLGCQSISVK